MKLGYIDYLNCYPFYYHLFEKKSLPGVRIFPARPNILNRMMVEQSLDMSPISAATCAEISDRILLLPDFCLSSVGYVGSVILVSKVPIETLDGKKVALTNASHTSVVLLKTLMKKYYHANPEYIRAGLVPDTSLAEATLLIGNEAMKFKPDKSHRVYDLGDLWLKKSGFPIVFAAFAIGKEAVDRYATEIRSIVSSFYQSLDCLKSNKENLIDSAHRRYPDIGYDLDAYYDCLKFYFTDILKQALDFYCQSAGELGFLNMPQPFDFYDDWDVGSLLARLY